MEHQPNVGTPIYIETSISNSMELAIRLERQAADLRRKGKTYEADITLADARDAWDKMNSLMDTLRQLKPDGVC